MWIFANFFICTFEILICRSDRRARRQRWYELLNILFWNLGKNAIEEYIIDCIIEKSIDIAVFSEFEGIDFEKIAMNLGGFYNYVCWEGQQDRKVTLVAKTTFCVELIQQQDRYNIYNIKTAVKDYLLAAVHLQDRRNFNTADRLETIRYLVADIEKNEDLLKCDNTIVIGDFNANPYDEELLSKYAFNAVLFKMLIDKNEFTNPRSFKRKRFYNPILHYISENTEMYGSFYYDRESITSYWHCLDQVLVRKDLADNIVHVEYLKRIGKRELLKNTIPNRQISDHLPLIVNLQEVENEN